MPSLKQLKQGQSDPTLKEEGVWVPIIVPDVVKPLRLKLRSVASDAVRMWEIRRFKEQRNYYIGDNVPPIEVIDQNEADKLAEVMVVDWDLTEDDDVTLVPCTVENVRGAMEVLDDVRRDAIAEAAKHAHYRKAAVAAMEKNSERPLSQVSATVAGTA